MADNIKHAIIAGIIWFHICLSISMHVGGVSLGDRDSWSVPLWFFNLLAIPAVALFLFRKEVFGDKRTGS